MLYILLTPFFMPDGSLTGTWHAADEVRSTEQRPFARCGESAAYPYNLGTFSQPATFKTNSNIVWGVANTAYASLNGQHNHEPHPHQHELTLVQATRIEAVLHSHFRPANLCTKCSDVLVSEVVAETFRTPRHE